MRLVNPKESDWVQVLNQISIAFVPNQKYIRIECPILLTSPIVAVLFSSVVLNNNSWQFVGNVSNEIRTGIVVGGGTDARFSKPQPLYANHLQLFYFPLLASAYTLVADVNRFGNQVNIFAWEYTGEIVNG